jgi:uncharacterized protein (DUF1499 family)
VNLYKWLGLLVVVLTAAWLALAFPHVNDVETGRSPDYPDLKPREYAADGEAVSKAAMAAVESLGWTYVGSGRGPGGREVKAIARTRVFRFPNDVTVKIRTEKGRTAVSVRSTSQFGKWDFGQNARNIRAFFASLDRQVK